MKLKGMHCCLQKTQLTGKYKWWLRPKVWKRSYKQMDPQKQARVSYVHTSIHINEKNNSS
jgi:hypothetical protein